MGQQTSSRDAILGQARALDASAAYAEKMRAGFSSAIWTAEGMLREGRNQQDQLVIDLARIRVRDARRLATRRAVERDLRAAHAFELRESLGDHIPSAALSVDYRLRYAEAANKYATTATLIYLGQDSATLVAAEAAATWEERNPGLSFTAELTRVAGHVTGG